MSDTQQKFLDQQGVEYLWSKIAKQENDTTVLLKDIVEAIDEIKANKEDVLQSDWNQNDNAAKDYIKNRPFYEKVELSGEYLISGTTFTSEFIGEGADGIWYGTTFQLDPQLIQNNNNRQVNVTINNHQFNGKVEIIDQGFNILLLESPWLEITGWLDDNPAGMIIREYQLYSIGENSIIVPDGENSISLEFMTQELKTIDPQFLPSVQSDWNVDDEKSLSHIANRPFYEKVINTEIVPEITVIGQSMGEDPDTGAVRWGFAVSFESFSWLEGRQIIKFIIDGEVYEFEVEPNHYWEGSSDRFLFKLILDDWPRYVNVYDRRELQSSYVFSLIQSGVSEIKKIDRRFLPNSTADWNANDSTIEGYIANRTHYLNIGEVVDIPNPQNRYQRQSAAFYTGIHLLTSDIELYLISNFPNATIIKNNYGFKVYDRDNLIAYYLTWDAEWHEDEIPNPDPFYDEYGDQFGGITAGLYVCLQECMDSQYNIWYEPYNLGQITCVNSVEKLKDYYLPDTVARKSDIHSVETQLAGKADKTNSVYYVEGTEDSSESYLRGINPEITNIYNGLTIAYKIPYDFQPGPPIFLQINNLPEHRIYNDGISYDFASLDKGSIVLFVFTETDGVGYWHADWCKPAVKAANLDAKAYLTAMSDTSPGSTVKALYFSNNNYFDANGELYINDEKVGKHQNSIFYVVAGGSGSTWTASSSEITEYYDGLTIACKTTIAGGYPNTTLNINGLGAAKIRRAANKELTYDYAANSVLHLTYITVNGVGYWCMSDLYYYDNDYRVSSDNKVDTKLFLVGATAQGRSSGSTIGYTGYSNKNCYIGEDNNLYSNGAKVLTINDSIGIETDTTLSVSNMAADAAAVGEAIAAPKYVAQDTAPEDTNLLWIDTSDEVGTAVNPKTEIILKSSTAGSTKQFRITINDDGVLTATEIG